MQIHELNYKGYFEEQESELAERLQLVEPENDLEIDQLSWAILPHPETIEADSARRDYVFNYEIAEHLGRGLYKLKLSARDASQKQWHAEIAVGLVSVPAPAEGGSVRQTGCTPFWFLSKQHHFKADHARVEERYPGQAFGKLDMARLEALPHRRLFRAV